MPKLLQINVVSNVLSTGKIAEDIAKEAQKCGWDCYIAYGRMSVPSVAKEIRIGNKFDVCLHFFLSRIFDIEGLLSIRATKKLIKEIQKINPDVIHLHNIHDHYLNYKLLFEYFSKISTPIVWTQHDCWAFTGGCMYFDVPKCEQWMNKCNDCNKKHSWLLQRPLSNFYLKKHLFTAIQNLTLVPVSEWMTSLLKSSFLSEKRIQTIHNGIETSKFRPVLSKKTDGYFRVLGVASVWSSRKGLGDFVKLRALLPSDVLITLVGLNRKQIQELPKGIFGISRTTNVEELVNLYSCSDVFVNPTYSDNFPTTNLEALACGTPVITYKTGGSPEAIDENTGIVVKTGDVESLANSILYIRKNPFSPQKCRERAVELYDKSKCYEAYMGLYSKLLD